MMVKDIQNTISIAHPSEKGGYNTCTKQDKQRNSIAHPSEKGGG